MELVNSQEAAEMLDVPDLAIGQCLLDGKLEPVSGFDFDKEDVLKLKESESKYLNSLK